MPAVTEGSWYGCKLLGHPVQYILPVHMHRRLVCNIVSAPVVSNIVTMHFDKVFFVALSQFKTRIICSYFCCELQSRNKQLPSRLIVINSSCRQQSWLETVHWRQAGLCQCFVGSLPLVSFSFKMVTLYCNFLWLFCLLQYILVLCGNFIFLVHRVTTCTKTCRCQGIDHRGKLLLQLHYWHFTLEYRRLLQATL